MAETVAANTSATDADLDDGNLILEPVTSASRPLPDDFYPSCWHDDSRMSVLFAPFRSKSLNPLNYDTKLHFWTQLINRYCDHKGSASVSLAELRETFRRTHKAPYALGTVLQEMRAAGQARPANEFLQPPQHTWRGWAQKQMSAAIVWPVSKVSATLWPVSPQTGTADVDAHAAWILLDAVDRHANELQRNAGITARVLDLATIGEAQHEGGHLSAEGVRLAVHRLHCARLAVVRALPADGGDSVTLVKINAAGADGRSMPEISDIDCNVYRVQQTVRQLQQQLDRLDAEHQEADRLARQLVHEKKTTLAKAQLRKRKLLDQKIQKESDKLQNVENLLASIEDSQRSASVLDAYKLATNALRQTHAASGMTVDSVDDVLADVQEALDDQAEIQRTLGDTKLNDGNAVPLDESALDAELADLLALDEQKEQDMNASIERRLQQLQIGGFGHLSIEEQNDIIANSVEVMRNSKVVAE